MLLQPTWKSVFLSLALALCCVSCEDEVDLYIQGVPIPIVYCILNPHTDLQYVRIGRSFEGTPDIYTQSPAADSTVWNLPYEVYMEEYVEGKISQIYQFEPDTLIRKDTGFFPISNLRLFVSLFTPISGREYHLYVYFPDLDKMVSAKTTINGAPKILDPLPLAARKINFEPGQPYIIHWQPGYYTGVYEIIFRVHYQNILGNSEEFHYADYSSGGIFDQRHDQMIDYSMGGPAFFAAMKQAIPVIPGIERKVISVEFIMISGGDDLAFHYRSMLETGSNFSNLSEYSNMRNGLGIFCSRMETKVPNLSLSNVTLDALAHSEITQNLGFKDSKGE